MPSTSRENLNALKSDAFIAQSLLNEHNVEKELRKEAQLANIEQLEQEILENEMINEELANQELQEQHIRNMRILNQFDNFTGSYMPNVTRRPLRGAADDYFGTRRQQKILARQQQINRVPGDYAFDDLYLHYQDPRTLGNQYVHNVQTGGFQLNRNKKARHATTCLGQLTHNYPHRSNLTYDDPNVLPAFDEYPSRSRKLVENLTTANPEAIALQNLHNLPATLPVVQTATSSNLYDAANLNQRLIPATRPRYSFPIKRVFLTRESKERTALNGGNPFGIQLIGGQPIPGSNVLGAFVVKILPGSLISTLGELREGDQILEWNGIPLTGLRNNDVQQIIINSYGLEEVELAVKDDRMPVQLVQQQYLPPNATVEYATIAHNLIDPNLMHHQQQFVQPTSQIITSTAPQLISMPTQIIPNSTVTLNTATVLRGNQPAAMQQAMFGQQPVRQFQNQTIQLQQPQMIGANAYITQQPTNMPQGQTILPGGQTITGQPMFATNQPMQPGQTIMTGAQQAPPLGKLPALVGQADLHI